MKEGKEENNKVPTLPSVAEVEEEKEELVQTEIKFDAEHGALRAARYLILEIEKKFEHLKKSKNNPLVIKNNRVDPESPEAIAALQSWAKILDRMNRLDKHSWNDIKAMIDIACDPSNGFVVMSAQSLREKQDNLLVRKNSNPFLNAQQRKQQASDQAFAKAMRDAV